MQTLPPTCVAAMDATGETGELVFGRREPATMTPENKDVAGLLSSSEGVVADAAGEAFNNMYHKCRAEVSMDWWQRIWSMAVQWAWENPQAGATPTLRSALNAMLTQFGMDEDEWNKPTFDQARRAIDSAPRAALASQPGCAVEGEAVATSAAFIVQEIEYGQAHGWPRETHEKLECMAAAWKIRAALQVNSTEMTEGAKGSLTGGK